MSRHISTKARRRLVEILLVRDGPYCTWCCRRMIDQPIHPFTDCNLNMTLEHLLPLSLGGTHEPRNLALACHQCNNDRANQAIDYVPTWLRMA